MCGAILASKKDEENSSRPVPDDHERRRSDAAYVRLRDSSVRAHGALVRYASLSDSPTAGVDENDGGNAGNVNGGPAPSPPSDRAKHRAKLMDVGKSLWMNVRNHPEIFADGNAASGSAGGQAADGASSRAEAGGYVRAVAARLVLLDHIGADGAKLRAGSAPEARELVFGLKNFSRAGRSMLGRAAAENGDDVRRRDAARSSFGALSLAASCFDAVAGMARGGDGSASDQLPDLLDEAFDAVSALPDAASLLGRPRSGTGDGGPPPRTEEQQQQPWQQLVVDCLQRAGAFVDDALAGEGGDAAARLAVQQRFLPALTRLCHKHGRLFVDLKDYASAKSALRLALSSTSGCLGDLRRAIREGREGGTGGRNRNQVLHNLENELVVLSTEAFYLLSAAYRETSDRAKAYKCLDKIEDYMNEQQSRDDELYAGVMDRMESEVSFVFSEAGATASSAIEGKPRHQFCST